MCAGNVRALSVFSKMFNTEVKNPPRRLVRATNILTVTLLIINTEFVLGQISYHWMTLRKRVGTRN